MEVMQYPFQMLRLLKFQVRTN